MPRHVGGDEWVFHIQRLQVMPALFSAMNLVIVNVTASLGTFMPSESVGT